MLQAAADEGDDMGEKKQVIVVGGGASGLPCLASASEAISSNSNELSDLEKLQLQLQRMVRQLRSLNRMRIRAGKSV